MFSLSIIVLCSLVDQSAISLNLARSDAAFSNLSSSRLHLKHIVDDVPSFNTGLSRIYDNRSASFSLTDLPPSKILNLPLAEIGILIEQILQMLFISLFMLTCLILFTGVLCLDISHQ